MSVPRQVSRAEFRGFLQRALESAAERAEDTYTIRVPREFVIELHAGGHAGDRLMPDAAADALYLGPDRFLKIVDVAILQAGKRRSIAFVRASGFDPVPWEMTFDPAGLGPFAPTTSDEIKASHLRRLVRRALRL